MDGSGGGRPPPPTGAEMQAEGRHLWAKGPPRVGLRPSRWRCVGGAGPCRHAAEGRGPLFPALVGRADHAGQRVTTPPPWAHTGLFLLAVGGGGGAAANVATVKPICAFKVTCIWYGIIHVSASHLFFCIFPFVYIIYLYVMIMYMLCMSVSV